MIIFYVRIFKNTYQWLETLCEYHQIFSSVFQGSELTAIAILLGMAAAK